MSRGQADSSVWPFCFQAVLPSLALVFTVDAASSPHLGIALRHGYDSIRPTYQNAGNEGSDDRYKPYNVKYIQY